MELCREVGALYIDTVVEPWPASISTASSAPRRARTTRCAKTVLRKRAAQARRHHRGVVLRRQSRHGVVVRQAGAGRSRERRRARRQRAGDPRGMGASSRSSSASRASTSPSATPSAPSIRSRSTCSSTPGRWKASCRRACSRPSSAGAPTRSGCRRTAARHEIGCQAAIYLLQPGADTRVRSWTPDRAGRNTASWSRTTSRSRSPTTSRCATATRPSTGRPATTPITRATTPCCRCTRCSARRQDAGDHAHPRRERDRRRHRRARRAALRPREECLLVRLAALDRGDAAARALPERHRPAGDLGRARRHGLGAGEPEPPASSRPTRWTSAAASRCRCPISAR